ncbi:hypothetical protein [Parapedobacter sp. DT-150]|uniref:hypothetical protein n=1 Tax=Parapedobacter sp. DT-150 TaxID=3396162 RepID=UPI003F1D5AE0
MNVVEAFAHRFSGNRRIFERMYQSRREDYIERLVKRFLEVLERMTGKGPQSEDEPLEHSEGDMLLLYEAYFGVDRSDFLRRSVDDLPDFAKNLDVRQLRPLALLLYHDAMRQPSNNEKRALLERAKWLLGHAHGITGQMDFEDVQILNQINQELNSC